MDDKQLAELRKFISTVTDPKISPFIDIRKLCNSGIYNLSVQMAAEHAAKHHDFSLLDRILVLLDGTQHASDFVSSLRPKLNFVITETKPRKFKRATPEQLAKATKQATNQSITVKATTEKRAKQAKKKPRVSNDIMDSRLILPGSYGTGRRR